jgi:hypothetical protein
LVKNNYADDILLIGKKEFEIIQLFIRMENITRKLGLQINQYKPKYVMLEKKEHFKTK